MIMIKITWIMDNEDDNVHVHDFNCHEIYGRRREFSRRTFQMMTTKGKGKVSDNDKDNVDNGDYVYYNDCHEIYEKGGSSEGEHSR